MNVGVGSGRKFFRIPLYNTHIEYEVERQRENSISFPLTDTRKCLYNELYPEAKISPALDSQFNYKQQKSVIQRNPGYQLTMYQDWPVNVCCYFEMLFNKNSSVDLFVIILRMVRILSDVYKTSFVLSLYWEHRIGSKNGRQPAQKL